MRWMDSNDHNAIRAVLAGDTEAYRALVLRHSQALFRVAFRITGDEADADEVVQEALLRGYQRLASFQFQASFGTWIYRIAVNCAFDSVQRRGREAGEGLAESNILENADGKRNLRQEQISDPGAGPERLMLSNEIGEQREFAMLSLTPLERTAFLLRHMEEQTTGEIAAALNIAPNAAKQAVFRAVQKLRRRLAPLRQR
jgi:RNA polymerase sigma-70 factor, ECF subfamily